MLGTTLNQRFRLDKELGRGGMGAVYRATDLVLQRPVAIKVLKEQSSDDLGKQLRVEAQILARLLHDNIVRIYDFGDADGLFFLVMEEVDGTSYLKRWRQLALDDRLRVIGQVAEALDYAHHQGVIHRDIKPGNVLLTSADQPKLSDFGLSMLAGDRDESGVIRGTPHYMSPEQGKGRRLDHRTDLYSLGVMLYESVVGAVPFTGASMAIIAQHINEAPAPPRSKNPEISEALERLILRMLAKDPLERPVSGHIVARELLEMVVAGQWRRDESRATALPAAGANGTAAGPESLSGQPTAWIAPAPAGAAAKPAPPVPGLPATSASPGLVQALLDPIVAEPIVLSPDERYLCGHYLAYLLGGSRRRGILLRRPLDPLNADRARLLLAMTSVMTVDGAHDSVARAAELLDSRVDVRASLSPVVVMKYIACRENPSRRKRFRQLRKQLQEASPYAREHMTDANGLLNPGLMPQKLDDLRQLAPKRTEVDDQLIARWNRVTEAWLGDPAFRQAVLRYATLEAWRDPASSGLWPEVVYPLIERARWQRRQRNGTEAVIDSLASALHVPDRGVRLDRAIKQAVPAKLVEDLDEELKGFTDEPRLELEPEPAPSQEAHGPVFTVSGASLRELVSDAGPAEKSFVRLANPDPIRFLVGDLRKLSQEALAVLRAGGRTPKAGHKHVPVGPYRLVVVPSVRGKSGGQVAIQGMPHKQIEMVTSSIIAGSDAKPLIAVWVYQDQSLAIAYVDFRGNERYILWHAPSSQQDNFDSAADLNHALFSIGLEAPDQLDRALSKRFRPKNPV